MPIIVTCECGKRFQTGDENAGQRALCAACGRELIVPRPGPGPYAPLEVYDPRAPERTSGMAIASLVLGLMSCGCLLTILTGIPAVILGALGLRDIGRSQGRTRGKVMAITGVITGALGSSLVPLMILIGLLLPGVQAASEAARRSQCANNLKLIGLALQNFHDANGHFPPPATLGKDGKPLLSWRVAILPFIEQEALYNQFHLDEPWDSPHNMALMGSMPTTYTCPSEQGGEPGLTRYQVFVGPGSLFENDQGARIADITDGMSNTLMVAEARDPVYWTKPADLPFDPGPNAPLPDVGSNHRGGFNALIADGAVRFLKDAIDPSTLRAMITRNGGEPIRKDSTPP